MSSFVDKYYDDLAAIKTELVNKVNRLLPRLETLSETQLIELSKSLDFFQEAKRLGYDNIAKEFEAGINKEVAATLKKTGQFGVSLGDLNLESLQLIMDLELESIVSENKALANQLKKEVFRGLVTGESINSIAERIETEFSGTARIAQSRVATNEAVSRLFRTTTQKAFEGEWPKLLPRERAKYLRAIGDKLRENAEMLGEIETIDTGKLYRETKKQAVYIAEYYDYYAGLADKVEGTVLPIDKPNVQAITTRIPIGVIAAIIPWNSQMLLTAVKLAPALAMGNTVVIKASDPLCTTRSSAFMTSLVVVLFTDT